MKDTQNSPKLSPVIILLFGIIAISTSSLIVRNAQKEVPSLVIAAARLVIAAVILGSIALYRNRLEIKSLSKKQSLFLGLSGLFLAGHFATWITSLEYTSIVSSVMLVCSTPLWVAILSPFVIKEKPKKMVWIGMILTIIGAVLIGISSSITIEGTSFQYLGFNQKSQSRELVGNILALTGAWCETGYILIGRGIRKKISLVPYTFIVYGSAAVILLITIFILGLKLTGYSPQSYFWMTALAVVPQLIGHTSFNWALGYINATNVSIAFLGEPLGTSILSYLLLKEIPTIFEIGGGLLILIGIYITTKSK
jgi:drug/metabolite transporter (DMT)-like permease